MRSEQQITAYNRCYNGFRRLGAKWPDFGRGGISRQLTELQSYHDLERYLRTFVNALGDPVPYDCTGAIHLLDAILDNLRAYALEAELEDIGGCFSQEQIAFLQRLAASARAGPREPIT